MSGKRFVMRSILAAGDQALVSLGNLAVGLAFVAFAPKHEYGQYSMVFAGMLLGQSLQNAAFLSPMLTILPALAADVRKAAMWRLARLQAVFVLGLAVLGGILYWFSGQVTDNAPVTAAAVAAAVAGVLMREAVRGTQYATERVSGAFAGSLIYSILLAGGVTILVALKRFELLSVMLLIAIAGLAASLVLVVDREKGNTVRAPPPEDLHRQVWECARWALPSVVVSWLMSFAYVYPLGAIAGTAAVADAAAARLFLVPVSLLATGWSNVFRPRARTLLTEAKLDQLESLANRSALAMMGVTILMGTGVALLLPVFEQKLTSKYVGILPIVLAWTVYFCIQTARGVGMATMLASSAAYKPLYKFGFRALLATAPGVLAACMLGSPAAVVAALTVGEIVLLYQIRQRGWPAIRARANGNQP